MCNIPKRNLRVQVPLQTSLPVKSYSFNRHFFHWHMDSRLEACLNLNIKYLFFSILFTLKNRSSHIHPPLPKKKVHKTWQCLLQILKMIKSEWFKLSGFLILHLPSCVNIFYNHFILVLLLKDILISSGDTVRLRGLFRFFKLPAI